MAADLVETTAAAATGPALRVVVGMAVGRTAAGRAGREEAADGALAMVAVEKAAAVKAEEEMEAVAMARVELGMEAAEDLDTATEVALPDVAVEVAEATLGEATAASLVALKVAEQMAESKAEA